MGRGAATAVTVVLLAVATACGGGDDGSGEEAREASCELEGSHPARVTLVEEGDAFRVTFEGQPVPTEGRADYSVLLQDDATDAVAQLRVRFEDNLQVEHTVSLDGTEPAGERLDGATSREGDRLTAEFPKQAAGLSDFAPGAWSAALVLDTGATTASDGGTELGLAGGVCPRGERFQPFP